METQNVVFTNKELDLRLPDVIAGAVLYVASQPANVDVFDIVVRPTLEG